MKSTTRQRRIVASLVTSAERLAAAGPYRDIVVKAVRTLPVTAVDKAKVAALAKEIAEIERAVIGCSKRTRAAADRLAKIHIEKNLLT